MEVVALPQRLPQLLRGDNHRTGWDCRVDRGCGLGDHGEMAWIAEERPRGSLPTSYGLRATGYELYRSLIPKQLLSQQPWPSFKPKTVPFIRVAISYLHERISSFEPGPASPFVARALLDLFRSVVITPHVRKALLLSRPPALQSQASSIPQRSPTKNHLVTSLCYSASTRYGRGVRIQSQQHNIILLSLPYHKSDS
jgi:hypothetical protein